MSVAVISSLIVILPSNEYIFEVAFLSFMIILNAIMIANEVGATYSGGAIVFFLSHHSRDSTLQLSLLVTYVAESITFPIVLLVFFWAPEIYTFLFTLVLYSVLYSLIGFSIGSLSKSPLVSILLVVVFGFLPFLVGFESTSNSAALKEIVALSPIGGTLLIAPSTHVFILDELSSLVLIFLAISIYVIVSGRGIR